MSDNALRSDGTQLLREDTPGGGVFSQICEIYSINIQNTPRTAVDASDYCVIGENFLAGKVRAGTIQLSSRWDSTNTGLLNMRTDYETQNQLNRAWRVVNNDGTYLQVNGHVQNFQMNYGGDDDLIDVTWTIQMSGARTYA